LFAATFNEETEFGTYLNNLYVSSAFQRQGVAKSLLRQTIPVFKRPRKELPVHLLVFAKNIKAVAVYDQLGGIVIDKSQAVRAGNTPVELLRYQWPSAQTLFEKLDG